MAPTHGAITAGSTVTSGVSVSPTGWAYTPTTGYSGTDSFTIQVNNGTNTVGTMVYVTVNPLPVAGAITGTTMLCVGAPGALIDIAPGGVWSVATTGVVALSGSAGTTISVTGLAVGTDTVYYMVTNSCGTAAAYTVVTVNPLPDAGTITGTGTLCAGASVSLADAAPGGVWSSATTGIVTLSGSSGPGITATGIMAGTDTVYYTVTNSCGTDTAAFPITVITVPLVPPIIGPSLICGDMIISLTDSLPGGIWSSYDTTIATVDMSGTVSGSMPGIDTIYYTVTNSCGTSFAMHIVTINTLPVVANITAPIVLCADSAAAVSNATPGGSWAATNHHSFLSGSVVTGTTPGFDTITYSVTNLCGTTTVSHVIHMLACDSALAVPFAHQQASIRVVPNPSKGMVTLTVNTPSVQQVQVVVTNMLGIKMHECTFVTNTPKELNVNLPSGMYFISATTTSGVKMSAKLVVE